MALLTDVAIIGAGIAGASLAAEVAPHRKLVLIEREDQPGYHSTGRSAAFWSESYGGPYIQPLTRASGSFLSNPPADFHEGSFLLQRGALTIGRAEDRSEIDSFLKTFSAVGIELQLLTNEEMQRYVPGLFPDWSIGLLEPSCSDIDVAALHGAYLKAARRSGGAIMTDAEVMRIERRNGGWLISTKQGEVETRVIVNAAGAWADHIAQLAGVAPVGIQPYRRTIAQVQVSPSAPAGLPLVIDVNGRFYFKPEAGGRLWLSPHDETACEPSDCGAEVEDVALAIDRMSNVVDWEVRRVEHSWAGLRSFAPDRLPVYGYSPEADGFFWCAGQGGFGIQTAPAGAKLAASLLLGSERDPSLSGVDASLYSAGRFAN